MNNARKVILEDRNMDLRKLVFLFSTDQSMRTCFKDKISCEIKYECPKKETYSEFRY
jgi:hypothetical protein